MLTDPQKRALYDQYGHSGVDQKFRQEDIFRGTDFRSVFEGFGDFNGGGVFETFFGDLGFDLFGTGGRKRRRGGSAGRVAERGRDLESPLPVTLEEAFHGTQKSVSLGARTLTVTVPPGVKTGSRLRVKGEGEDGTSDLYLVVEVLPHQAFRREGSDLLTEVSATLPQAILGAELSVPTLQGSVMMGYRPGPRAGRPSACAERGCPTCAERASATSS